MRDAWLYASTKDTTREIGSALAELGYSPRHVAGTGRGSGRAPELAVVVATEGEELHVQLLNRLRNDEELVNVPLLLAVQGPHLPTAEGLALADELIVRPCSLEELRARVARARRNASQAAAAETVRIGGLELDLATYEVTIDGQAVAFPYMEYELLKFLATHPNRAFSREALLTRVWRYDYFGGARTVDVHVRRIRTRLGPEYAARLRTVRSVGYLFDAREAATTFAA
jgi:DNA-binding response OmpR family regulator